ncbi:phage tail protein [Sodalis sp. RH15]|uniref:phage tail protein n=1 Tax=Sodalis sp. RH15 TaxID=3394330 RepID=UPI0039B57E0E
MMMILGLFVFTLSTAPYQTLNRSLEYRWPTNSRVGLLPAAQFLGQDNDAITLSGVLLPEVTGGRLSLLALETMAAQGKAWPLIEGSGRIYGTFVVTGFTETRTEFFADGAARRIEFTLNLMRVDESLTAMFGDLKDQAGSLLSKAKTLAGKAQSVLGGFGS